LIAELGKKIPLAAEEAELQWGRDQLIAEFYLLAPLCPELPGFNGAAIN